MEIKFCPKSAWYAIQGRLGKDTRSSTHALHRLTDCLYETTNSDDMQTVCGPKIAKILKTKSAAFLPTTSGDTHSALQIPIVLDGRVVTNLHLSEKSSKQPYTKDELEVLHTFSKQAALAFSRLEQKRQAETIVDISHAFQTPLTVLQVKLEELKNSKQNSEALHDLGALISELSKFVSELLHLAHIENSTEEPRERFSMTDLVQEVAEEAGVITSPLHIEVRRAVACDIYVQGDARKIREAIHNIVNNSIKYMSTEQKGAISFELTKEHGYAVLSVKDTGIGILPSDLPHIFDRFWRAQNAKHVSGSGLGLTLAKFIVERHGGSLEAHSELGHGATLTMRLPCIM